MLPLNWSPIIGCSPASPGCVNCYAPDFAKGDDRLTVDGRGGKVWTGALRFDEQRLFEPRSNLNPSTYLVCPHGDLFHENAKAEWLDAIFDVMEATGHTFQIATKRPARMRVYLLARYGRNWVPSRFILGTHAERQIEADARILELLAIKSNSLFLSIYPLLGPVSLEAVPQMDFSRIREVHAGEDIHRPAEPHWFAALAAECATHNTIYRKADLLAEVAKRGF